MFSYCTHTLMEHVGREERKKVTLCILLSLPYIRLESNFMGQIFLENFSTAVRYRYSLWKHTADSLFGNCLKRSWKRSGLRESSFAVREDNFMQNAPLPLNKVFQPVADLGFSQQCYEGNQRNFLTFTSGGTK